MALGTQPHGKMLDYEQFIDHQLARTQSKIKTTDILIACLTLATAFIAVLFLEIVLDHMLGLPIWVRQMILWGGIAGAATYSGFRIARPFLRRVNGFYAAKTIEDTDPHFKNSLINYLDLRKHREELPKRVLRAIEAKAVGDLTKVEIDSVVNQKRVLHTWYALMGVIMVFFLYYGFAPKSVLDSAKRAFLADVVRPTNTRLDSIKPGDDPELAKVVAGTHVPFSVDIQGVRPEKVTLHYSIDGGQFYLAQDFAPGPNLYDPWQTQLRNVQQNIEYYITGGDAESRRYRVKVLPAPMVTGVKLDFVFPEYTGVPRRMGVDGGAVEAIEGTSVVVHARTNQPVQSATIDMGKDGTPTMEVSTEDPQEIKGEFEVKSDGSYTIKFVTTGGQRNPDPVVYDIRAIKDQIPTVRFVAPEPRIKLPSNGKVALKIEAGDDYGVKALNLNVVQGSEQLVSRDLLENKKPTRKWAGTEILDLSTLKLKPGTQIEYWLVARDTKDKGGSNSAKTEKQIIELIEPLKPADLAKANQKVERENPPTPPEEQPKGEKEQQEAAQSGLKDQNPQKDPADPKAGGANDLNSPTNPDVRPPAEQNPNEKPQSAEDQKTLADLDKKLKNLDTTNQNSAPNDPNNQNPQQPQPATNPSTPPTPSQPQPGNPNNAPGDVSPANSNPQPNPPGSAAPTPPKVGNSQPKAGTQPDVSQANKGPQDQTKNPPQTNPNEKPQDQTAAPARRCTNGSSNPNTPNLKPTLNPAIPESRTTQTRWPQAQQSPATSPALNPRISLPPNPVINPGPSPTINPAQNQATNPDRNPVINPAQNPVINPAQNLASRRTRSAGPARRRSRNPVISPAPSPAINQEPNLVINQERNQAISLVSAREQKGQARETKPGQPGQPRAGRSDRNQAR